jgi:hypothetical protein
MASCRDCGVCTRLGVVDMVKVWFRLIYNVFFRWNIGLFIRHCPQCGHWLSQHARRADGSFID